MTSPTVDLEISSILTFYNSLGLTSTKFHYLTVFTSWNVVQHKHCNYLGLVCDVINFETNINSLVYITKKSGQKCEYPKKKKSVFNMK